MSSFIVRFDLMAKFLYIKYREKEVHTAFFKNLYQKQKLIQNLHHRIFLQKRVLMWLELIII